MNKMFLNIKKKKKHSARWGVEHVEQARLEVEDHSGGHFSNSHK